MRQEQTFAFEQEAAFRYPRTRSGWNRILFPGGVPAAHVDDVWYDGREHERDVASVAVDADDLISRCADRSRLPDHLSIHQIQR